MTNKEYLESLSESELEIIICKRPWFPYVKNYVLSSPENCKTDGIKKWLDLIYSGLDGADYSKKAILEREANNYFERIKEVNKGENIWNTRSQS